MKLFLSLSGAVLALTGSVFAAPPASLSSPSLSSPSLSSPSLSSPSGHFSFAPLRVQGVGEAAPTGPQVRLTWGPVFGAQGYTVFRDGRVLAQTGRSRWTDRAVEAGETYVYRVSAFGLRGTADSAAVRVRVPAIQAPPDVAASPDAPQGVTATPEWEPHCPKCGGMAMAHVVLGWASVPGTDSYTVYRDSAKVQEGLTAPGWIDMGVEPGGVYVYTVTASGPGGESAGSAPAAVTAPLPPGGGMGAAALTAPTNLAVRGVWSAADGRATDVLAWSAVPGAVSYTVYQYGVPIAGDLKASSYRVPPEMYCGGLTYTVTAVESGGMESLPSAPATALGALDPAFAPNWMPDPPVRPHALVAVPEWNGGGPRVHLTWQGSHEDDTYTVYRDGRKVAEGLWGLSFYDADVLPGQTHLYTVSGVNVPWTEAVESARSAPVSARAVSGPPEHLEEPVRIVGTEPNDDSVRVMFAPVPGARDYRVYDARKPGSVKYSGGSLSIEMNGLDPGAGATLVVEAVDKLGPFQTMDGMAGPGAMQMDGMHVSINGQGDPSNVPNVLAVSAPFAATCRAAGLGGSQVFFDDFHDSRPLAARPCPSPVPGDNGGVYGHAEMYAESGNDKWAIRNYGGDLENTRVFVMSAHFMDTLYDGGTPRRSVPLHNNNASLVMMPRQTAEIGDGKVLHVTFEVDAHFNSRRWCDVIVAPAEDTLMNPGKLDGGLWATTSGTMFRWQIKDGFHIPQLFVGNEETDLVDVRNGLLNDVPGVERTIGWKHEPLMNGTMGDLDKRHRFDLYLSQTHFRLVENGELVKDADLPRPLPFRRCQPYFVHQLYHTGNDRPELVTWDPDSAYWYNFRPWADERHWDNMGFSVLDSLPPLP